MIIKICKKHGDLTLEKMIKSGVTHGKQRYKCKACMKEVHRHNYEKNKEKIKLAHELYKAKDPIKYQEMKNISKRKAYAANADKYRARRRESEKKNPQLKRDRNKKYKDKIVGELSDIYVRKKLCENSGLSRKDIPQELVEFKRIVMRMKREIRKRNFENKTITGLEKINETKN